MSPRACLTCGAEHASDACPGAATPSALATTTPATDPPERAPTAGDRQPGPAPGTVLQGRYRVIRKIGDGGMGSVHEVEHVLVGRRCALKLLHPVFVHDADHVARFHREARVAAAAGDAHVVDVLDMGVLEDGAPFIVMELLDGPSLRTQLEHEGAFPVSRAIDLARQCARALAAVHSKGVVHRDLKPDNVILVRGRDGRELAKIVDFGISKLVDAAGALGSTSRTRTGELVGTPYYMAPEQLRAQRDLDARTDVWALGVMLYEMLAGRRPFEGATVALLSVEILQSTPPPPSAHRSDVPAALDQVVLRALEKDRTARFGSMLELTAALDRVEDATESPSAPRTAPGDRSSKSWAAPWLVAGLSVLAAGGWALGTRRSAPASPPARASSVTPSPSRPAANAAGVERPLVAAAPPADGLAVTPTATDAGLEGAVSPRSEGARSGTVEPARRPADRGRDPPRRAADRPDRVEPAPPPPEAPARRTVSIRNSLRAEVQATFHCGDDGATLRVPAGATRAIALPATVCHVRCASAAVMPRCRPRLGPSDRALDVLF